MQIYENHFHLIDDTPSKIPNLPEFKENRHDQSAWSLLNKQHKLVNFPPCLYYERKNNVIAANRNKIYLPNDLESIMLFDSAVPDLFGNKWKGIKNSHIDSKKIKEVKNFLATNKEKLNQAEKILQENKKLNNGIKLLNNAIKKLKASRHLTYQFGLAIKECRQNPLKIFTLPFVILALKISFKLNKKYENFTNSFKDENAIKRSKSYKNGANLIQLKLNKIFKKE